MKKDVIFIIIASFIYSYLFFRQDAGINFLLFSVILAVFQLIRNKSIYKSFTWDLAVVGAIASGFGILLYGNGLSITANVVALLTMSFSAYSSKNSLPIGLFHSVYSISGSFVFLLLDSMSIKPKENGSEKKSKWNFVSILFYIILPVSALVVFFVLYRLGNSVFEQLTENIDLSFISLEWILFLIGGSLIMFGFFRHHIIKPFQKFDANTPNKLEKRERPTQMDSLLQEGVENKSGIVMFVVLNLLLLVVNFGDVIFITGGAQLASGVSLSDSVHQGIGALITSIVFAVLIILFYFRGRLNFIQNNKHIKGLAFFWIVQNLFLVASTCFRNLEYIEAHGLTYKRIGVYVYLGLTIIGLLFTLYKVFSVKTNWFLVRAVSWSFFLVLVITPLVNWDQLVLHSQINVANQEEKVLDVYYLVEMSSECFPTIIEYLKHTEDDYLKSKMENEIAWHLKGADNNDWRSFNVRNKEMYQFLSEHYSTEELEEIKSDYIRWRI
ncbi:MAG: hypothetical protein ACI9J3_001957 [Parvicellaceae bacterium]|jgi:hypothetical protein